MSKKNIKVFLDTCRSQFGLKDADLFQISDLFSGTNFIKVKFMFAIERHDITFYVVRVECNILEFVKYMMWPVSGTKCICLVSLQIHFLYRFSSYILKICCRP